MARSRRDPDAAPEMSEDDKIVKEAHERHKICEDFESTARQRYVNDVKFANADSDNQWQWTPELVTSRQGDDRPILTVNMTRQHNLHVKNDAKQNKMAIKIEAVGDGADDDAAECFEGVIRHIEYVSNAEAAYERATDTQVDGGVGYWRIVTDYIDSDSFDQEIYIRPVRDPLTILKDPDAILPGRLDARFAFSFEDMPRSVFNATYPKWKDEGSEIGGSFGSFQPTWSNKEHVRIAEYFRKTEKKDRLLAFQGQNGIETVRESKIGKDLAKALLEDPATKVRDVVDDKVEWFKIVGKTVVDKGEWPGKYIPIVMIVGEETWVDGEYDRKGHTRNMKDSQRLYNFMTSAAAENIALQNKATPLVDLESIEGYEDQWENRNTNNYAYLGYRSRREDGSEIAPPSFLEGPKPAAGYLEAMQTAEAELQKVSGQYQAELGMPGNEKSGYAINQRQRQADTATYHFVNALSNGIRDTGEILIDLIPKIYDTERVVEAIGEKGDKRKIALAPDAKQAFTDTSDDGKVDVEAIFNPNVGRYQVQADAGPGWATQRQETYAVMSGILQSAPDLVHVIGDLALRALDTPGMDEAAERLKRLVPPAALGDGPTPQEQQLQQQLQKQAMQIQAGTKLLAAMEEKLRKQSLALQGRDEKRDVEAYRAETDRMDVFKEMLSDDPEMVRAVMRELLSDARQTTLAPIIADNADELDFQADGVVGNMPQPAMGAPQ